MNIIQLIPTISGGGAERLVVDLSNQLVKNHKVTLLTLYNPQKDELFRDHLSPEIKTISLGKKLGFDSTIVPKLYKEIRRISPNIIHSHLRSFNYLMPIIPFMNDISVIHTIHNDANKECPNKKIRFIRKQFFRLKKVEPVAISQESARSFEETYPDIPYSLVYNGREYPAKSKNYDLATSEIENLKVNKKTKVFLNIGRQETQKNQLMLVKAFNRLVNKDNANAILLIIGGGRNNEASNQIQQKLKIAEEKQEYIHILGERSNATDYLYLADYFCLSSLYEGMPITLIEAFATGTLPICTPVGGIPEMMEELDSKLVSESINESDYYKSMRYALSMQQKDKAKLRKKAQSLFYKNYSIENCASNYLKIYNSLTNSTS